VPVHARLADSAVAGVRGHCVHGHLGCVDHGAQCQILGFPVIPLLCSWASVCLVNPMVGVIDGFRWCLLGSESRLYWPGVRLSLAISGFVLWLGLRQFRKMERGFADLI